MLDAAVAMRRAGRPADAGAIYRRLLDLNENDTLALWGFAMAKVAEESHAEARAMLERAVAIDPRLVHAFNDLGVICRRMGDAPAAESAYRAALAIDSGHVDTLYNYANLLADGDRADEAENLYRRALAGRPGHVGALNNLGRLLLGRDRTDDAIALFRQALTHDEGQPQTYNNLGNALKAAGALDDSVDAYRSCVEREPRFGDGWRNLSVVLQQMNRMDEAAAPAERAAALSPDNPELFLNLGTVMIRLGRYAEGRNALEKALALDPDYAEAHWNRSHLYLLDGDFRNGWAEYEWRLKCPGLNSYGRKIDAPPWTGGDLAGKTIFVHWEQGFGDTIQFARFLPLVKERGGTVVFECQVALNALFAGLPGVDRLVNARDAVSGFDCYAPLLSLPNILGTDLASIPAAPYLTAPRAEVALPATDAGRLRIGLVWAGRAEHGNDRNRSIPLSALRMLFDVPGCDFFSLQLGAAREQISAEGLHAKLIDLSGSLTDFSATAALIGSLDLVISVDTAVAHLAGALGRPIWVLLPFVPDWRWMLGRNDTPWYGTMRLFRQGADRRWETPVAAIGAALAGWRNNDTETEAP